MSTESKELERLQSEIQLLTTEISRSSLLRLSVAAFLLLSCAHAFRRVDRTKTEPKMTEIHTLAPLTGEDTSTLNVDPFQGFFLLRNMFGNKSAKSAPGRTQGERCVYAAESEAASKTLRRYAEANKDEELKKVLASYEAAPPACPAKGQQPGAGQTFRASPAPTPPPKDFLVTKELSDRAGDVQKALAEEVGKAHDAAFETELKLVGATIDLRNWFAFLPFLFLLSEVHLYILRRKRLLLAAAAASRVEKLGEQGGAVLTVERLMLYDGARVPPAYARHPSQFLEAAGAVIVLGLLIYLATAALPFFLVNTDTDAASGSDFLFSYVLGIGLPILIVVSTVAFYAAAYAVSVSGKLERQLGRAAGFTPTPGRFRTYWDWARVKLRRWGRVRRPRGWMVSGCSLILLTLLAGVGFDSCGSPERGYKLLTQPAQVGFVTLPGEASGTTRVKNEPDIFSGEPQPALWVTAFWGLARASGTEADGVWVARAVRLTQFAGRFVYAVALLLSLLTLALLALSAARVRVFRSRRLCLAFYRVSLWALIFFVTDLFLYFVMPRLRLAVLAAYLGVPFCLWLWHRVALGGGGGRWPQIRDVLRVLYFPAALLACLVLAAAILFTIYLVLENGEQTLLNYAGVLLLSLIYNAGIGLTMLCAGTGALCLGYRRLYDAGADGETTPDGPDGEAPPSAPG